MQERYNVEPELMSRFEKVQKLAAKVFFAKNAKDAQQKLWQDNQPFWERITQSPLLAESPNRLWFEKSSDMLSSYQARPIVVRDVEINLMLSEHLDLDVRIESMAKNIFKHQLKYDIICLQEANFLTNESLPATYQVMLADTSHSINGVAWKKERFELIGTIGNIMDKAFAVHLQDKQSGKTVLIASGHISGCNPFCSQKDPVTGIADSAKGDRELAHLIQLFDMTTADIKVIGMDSNVAATHPRLLLLKDAGYCVDAENFLEPTCTSPYQLLNTRIDWIALKSTADLKTSITNIGVLGVGLNSLETNVSDHKPIAAKIQY